MAEMMYFYNGQPISEHEYYEGVATNPLAGYIIPSDFYDSVITVAKNATYRCPYCDTLHDKNTGVCDRCGAPLSMAVKEG